MELVNVDFEVWNGKVKISRIVVKDSKLVVHEIFNDCTGLNPCPILHSFEMLTEMLSRRMWKPTRDNIREILDAMELEEYDLYKMIRKTHGTVLHDHVWLKFSDEPRDLCMEDVRLGEV